MKYRSQADLGGQPVAAPIVPDQPGGPFHTSWEARTHALVLAMGAIGAWNIDMARAARETLPDYRQLSYFQIWFAALERLLLERGLVVVDELKAGQMMHPPAKMSRRLEAKSVAAALGKGSPTVREAKAPARYAAGDRVRARHDAVPHHTRLPGYVRGKAGIVERVHGAHVFADAHAQGQGEDPRWLYTVVFAGRELWGEEGVSVSVDAWEPYLEPA